MNIIRSILTNTRKTFDWCFFFFVGQIYNTSKKHGKQEFGITLRSLRTIGLAFYLTYYSTYTNNR